MKRLCVVLLWLSAAGGACGADWPALSWPEGVRVEVLAEDLRLNGQPVRLYRLHRPGAGRADELGRALEQAWGRRGRTVAMGDRHLLTVPVGDTFVTAQLQASEQGVHGHVMQMRPQPQGGLRAASPAGLPPQSRLLSQVDSADGAVTGSVTALQNGLSVAANDAHYQRWFAGLGLQRRAVTDSADRRARVVLYESPGRLARVLIQDLGEVRTVTVHQTREWK